MRGDDRLRVANLAYLRSSKLRIEQIHASKLRRCDMRVIELYKFEANAASLEYFQIQ